MIRFLSPVLGLFMLVGMVGCAGKTSDSNMSDSKMMSETDVCPQCRGVQKATAAGTCESCGAKIADACPTCPGVQVATTEGKCPSCGARMGR
jgi:Zn-finger nucleic acid-binding protein